MKIGLIVDGQGEPAALEQLRPKLKLQTKGKILRALYADLQPKASAGQIARKAINRVGMLRRKGATRSILLIDREDRDDCPPGFAQDIQRAFAKMGSA